MSATFPGTRRGRGSWRRWAGLGVAAVLLAFVARSVPWRDTLTLSAAGSDESQSFTGVIGGEWKSAAIRFRFRPGQDPRAGSPLAGALETVPRVGGELAVERGRIAGRAWREVPGGGLEPFGDEVVLDALVAQWRPGLPRAFGDLDVARLPLAFAFLLVASLLISTRWWRLLALGGCGTSWWTAVRLTYVGLFFNVVLPGSTGGDLARAYVVVRDHPERRAKALMSVLLDRVLGLVAMALVATIAVFTNDPRRFGPLRIWVLLAFLAMVGGVLAFTNPFLRRLVRFDRIVAKLPQGRRLSKLDEALRDHAAHPFEVGLAVLLSCGNHLCATGAVYTIGHAFGDVSSFHDYLCIATVANTLTAIPISPGGLGVGEMLFGGLFELAGALPVLGVVTSLVNRLVLVALGLCGGVFLLLPGGAAMRREFRATEQADAGEAGALD